MAIYLLLVARLAYRYIVFQTNADYQLDKEDALRISEAITKKPVHDCKCRASSFSNEKNAPKQMF